MEELEFPRMVYRAGGPVALESGAYSIRIVGSAEELAQAEPDGWRLNQYAAKAAAEVAPAEEPPAPEPDDNAPPTRAELLQKAAELGIKADGRWSDKRLAEAIAAKV